MSSAAYVRATFQETVLNNPFMPLQDRIEDGKRVICPSPKQAEFLSYLGREALFGGAAGGGKTLSLIMAALQYVQVPGYRALLVRRTFRQLTSDDGLVRRFLDIMRQKELLGKGGVQWSAEHYRLTFPSGATISFAYLDHERDKDNFQGPGWHFIGVDELTQFPKDFYLYLFSRLRRDVGFKVPLRMRGATNPGRQGHCVPFGEVLTPQGWKDIKTFRQGDPVYTVRHDGTLAESMVSQVHAYEHSGDMIHVNARGFQMVCTPNHRVAKVGGTRDMPGSRFTLIPFEELPGQTSILRSVKWEGTPLSDFSPRFVQTRKSKLEQPRSIPGYLFAQLFGWFISEGHTVDRDKAFGISQMKPQHRQTIRALLTCCNFHFKESKTGFLIYAADWWNYFRQFGKCRDKYIPDWIKNASSGDLWALFSAMMAGDGHWATEEVAGHYYTTSARLADDFSEVAVKLGYIVSVKSRQRTNREGPCYEISVKINENGASEIETHQHRYKVRTTVKDASHVERKHFDGMVYCIGVFGTHSFVIRQNGYVWVSGNSWVKARFLPHKVGDGRAGAKHFIKSLLDDNPGIDRDDYVQSLAELDIITRNQLMAGDWSEYEGGRFKSRWFRSWKREFDVPRGQWRYYLEGRAPEGYACSDCWVFGTCDPACTEDEANDPTAIGMFAVTPDKDLMVLGVSNKYLGLENICPELLAMCKLHHPMWVGIEGTAFQNAIVNEARKYPGLPTIRKLETKNRSKLVRATPAINRAHDGQIFVPEQGPQPEKAWIEEFIAELTAFTGDPDLDSHDDQVDVLAWAVLSLDEYGLLGVEAVNYDEKVAEEQYDDWDEKPSAFGFGVQRDHGLTGWGGRLSQYGRG